MRLAILWQRGWARWAMIFVVWTIVGIFFTCQLYFSSLMTERPAIWSEVLFVELSWCYLWASVTPFVLWLALRFQFERELWRRSLLIHILASVFIVIVLSAIHYNIIYFFLSKSLGRPYVALYMLRNAIYNFSEGMAPYWLMIVFTNALAYYQRFQQEQLTALRLKEQVAHAQLQALKMQLQPHFLFNTLHSISALVFKDIQAADRMIARLGDFLRLTLENAGAQEVTLERELEFLTCYLEIERTRFQDRLTTRVHADAQAMDARVPNLILQPLVENAIRHGIAPRSTPGQIEIVAALELAQNLLRIAVKDNGADSQANQTAKDGTYTSLAANTIETASDFKEGLGLTNTRTRLAQLYGGSQRMEITNNAEGGTTVTLWIPQPPERFVSTSPQISESVSPNLVRKLHNYDSRAIHWSPRR